MYPQRPHLATIVAREIQEGIATGKWRNWLPQERLLAQDLKVSRTTLRQAIAQLRVAGLVQSLHSKGNRIITPRARRLPRRSPCIINLLIPCEDPRLVGLPWVDLLRAELVANGCHLRVVVSRAAYSARPERALAALTRHNSAECWIIRLSTLPLQRWFDQNGIPAVITGTRYAGIRLPFVDIDHRAMCRHATGAVLAARHRNLALLIDRESKAGDLESERGFNEAVAASSAAQRNIVASISRYSASVSGVVRQLDRLFDREEPPTALIVAQSVYYLTVAGYLARRGLRIPHEVSLVAQVGAAFFPYLLPKPTYYSVNVASHAQKIFRVVKSRLERDRSSSEAILILPKFVRGESLAGPPSRAATRSGRTVDGSSMEEN